MIFLSAFKSNDSLYESHKAAITETLQKMHLSFERATFGTWRIVGEYLGKQTRQLLDGDVDSRSLCAELFSDPSLALPERINTPGIDPGSVGSEQNAQ